MSIKQKENGQLIEVESRLPKSFAKFNTEEFELDPSDKTLSLSRSVATKLSKLDTDTVPSENGMALAWDGEKYTPQKVKGGHELITVEDGVDGVLNNTEEEKVVDALVVKQYANTYTERVLMTLKAGENTIGIWQDEEPEDWVVDEDHFLFLPNFYQADDEELTFSLIFDTSNNEPIFRKGFEWVSQTDVMKDGKPCGALCIRCANAPTVDTIIGVDITRVRFDNVVVVSP